MALYSLSNRAQRASARSLAISIPTFDPTSDLDSNDRQPGPSSSVYPSDDYEENMAISRSASAPQSDDEEFRHPSDLSREKGKGKQLDGEEKPTLRIKEEPDSAQLPENGGILVTLFSLSSIIRLYLILL